MNNLTSTITELAKSLIAIAEKETINYNRELMLLAADALVKQAQLLEDAGRMVDKSIATLNMIVDTKIKTIH